MKTLETVTVDDLKLALSLKKKIEETEQQINDLLYNKLHQQIEKATEPATPNPVAAVNNRRKPHNMSKKGSEAISNAQKLRHARVREMLAKQAQA